MNKSLVPIKNDIDDSIRIKSGIVYVASQAFCECIMKYINSGENFIIDDEITLGTFLSNNEFRTFVSDRIDYGDTWLFDEINMGANDYKHNAFSQFSYEKWRKIYKDLYLFSAKVFNYYARKKITIRYDEEFIENLLDDYKPKEDEYELFNLKSREAYIEGESSNTLENNIIKIEDKKIIVRGICNEI